MKLADHKKFSVHLDMSALKQYIQVTHPLSTKRKNETTPTSPNTSARPSEKKFKPVQPLHTNNNAITIKNIISNFKNRADKENLNSPISTMSKFPLLVDQFARLYNLSPSELNELLTLKQVYYYKQSKMSSTGQNGEYVCYAKDHINYQYEIVNLIGQGSFGQVFQVLDHKSQKTFALKIIRNQEKLKKQAQVEANLLQMIKDRDPLNQSYIVRIENKFLFRGHQCIVFEKLDHNLFEVLKQQKFRGFDYDTLRKFSYQILTALNYLSSLKIVHCDLKPENVMVQDSKAKIVKLVDFGSGCTEGNQVYTYIQSRYYRAPEVMFGLKYGLEIDMWSFGCLVAEIHTGQPIFPGDNEVEQFNLIMEVIGAPPTEFALSCPRRKHFFEDNGQPKKTLKIYRKPQSVDLSEVLKTTDDDFVDFLMRCFTWDAQSRLKPQEALNHPWLQSVIPKNNFDKFKTKITKETETNFFQKSKTQQNTMVKEFEKKLSKDNLFLKLQHTRALIANNTLENKPSLSSRYINENPISSERIRNNIAHSIHQILSCRSNNASNTQFFRKPSLG